MAPRSPPAGRFSLTESEREEAPALARSTPPGWRRRAWPMASTRPASLPPGSVRCRRSMLLSPSSRSGSTASRGRRSSSCPTSRSRTARKGSGGASARACPSPTSTPSTAFRAGTPRQRLGLNQTNDFVNNVGYHEFAHQWWGHLVGAATYRDQWLEEGFSEFSSAVAVQHVKGWGAYESFWADARKFILGKYPGNDRPHFEAGPVTQGFRLSTQRTPRPPPRSSIRRGDTYS